MEKLLTLERLKKSPYLFSSKGKILGTAINYVVQLAKIDNGFTNPSGYGYQLFDGPFVTYRKEIKKITKENYFIGTEATFKSVNNGAKTYEEVEKRWEGIKKLGEHINSEKSSSEYVVCSNGDIYRFSDHWGERIASCDWHFKGISSESRFDIGVCNLREFSILEENRFSGGGQYVAASEKYVKEYPLKIEQVKKDLENFFKENRVLFTPGATKEINKTIGQLNLNSESYDSLQYNKAKEFYEKDINLYKQDNTNSTMKTQEIKQGDYVLITDRSSKFKTKYGVVKKVQSKGYIVTVDDNGKTFDAKVTKKGVLFSEKGGSDNDAYSKNMELANEEAKKIMAGKGKYAKLNMQERDELATSIQRKANYKDYNNRQEKHKTEEVENDALSQEEILTKEIEKIDEEIIALEKKRYELQEQKTKIIAQEILDGKRNAAGKPFMPWQKELTEDEIEFIISAINRYGSGDHPKASKQNWLSFKFDYIKGVLQKIDVKEHLGAEGAVVFKSVLTKFNL